jgi:ankyrin repeat protein
MIQPEALKKRERLLWSPGTGVDVWEMFRACLAGDLSAVKRLVGEDPSLVRSHYAYRTPIYFAVRENRKDVVAFLLEHGADPLGLAVNDSLLEICRDRGHGELEHLLEATLAGTRNASPRGEAVAAAIREHDLPRVKGLLDASPDLLHAGDARSNQPIHWATMTRQLEIIDELLARGADIDAARSDGARPIQLTNGDYEFRGWRDVPSDWPTTPAQVLAHLRARGAYCDIRAACHVGDRERVLELLDGDASLANRLPGYVTYYVGSGAPLRNAAANGHLEIVRLLLSRGADPNLREEGIAPHGHALYSAVANRHFEIARLLLEHGAFPNPEVESSADALSRAISNSDQPMIDLLCSYGAARALHLLAYSGDVQTAAAVLAASPALADDPDALVNAAGEGHEAFVRLLLRYQPDLPKCLEFPGWSVGARTRELNELLFEHGMNPSQPDWLHVTPLHHFARKGNLDAAAQFIDHGADLHARDEDICSTPLGWAAKFGQLPMVQLLLERGAKASLPDDPPWATPLAWATRRGHTEIAERLARHGPR